MAVSLTEIYEPVQAELSAVESKLDALSRTGNSEIADALSGIIGAGGKRLRPALLLTAAKACDYTGERAIDLAVAVELIHTASLIHDDIIDDAPVRRGMPTINARWGNRTSVLAGDYIYAKVIQILAEDGDMEIMRCMAGTACTMTDSELSESVSRHQTSITEEQYFSVIAGKTASLISCCCKVGALLGEVHNGEVDILGDYGRDLGMAFQIGDDLLDIIGDEAKLGKPLGTDMREGVLTLPVIYAFNKADHSAREVVLRHISTGNIDASALMEIRKLVEDCGAIEYSIDKAKAYGQQCQERLLGLRESESRQALMMLVDYVVGRITNGTKE